MAGDRVERIVAIGASNLTRGFATLVAEARSRWGPEVELLAALGHGRSYGAPSTFLIRSLPGILQSGLWGDLEARPPARTRALITDVGNDIMFGHPAARVLEWVDACAARLRRVTPDLIITGLPPAAIGGLSRRRYLLFRSMFYPRCRLALDQATAEAVRVEAGLQAIATRYGAEFLTSKAEWYGADPIHIRPGLWGEAWREILCGPDAIAVHRRSSRLDTIRLYCLQPERASFLGRDRHTPQHGAALRRGGRVWLY